MADIQGDPDATTTHAAVGSALSRWEAVEIGLAGLFSIFDGHAGDLTVMAVFGDKNRRFALRIAALQVAAEDYFRRHCSQDDEGAFGAIVAEAEELARIRANFAHGIVEGSTWITRPFGKETRYTLQAPWYAAMNLDFLSSTFAVGSTEIEAQAKRFDALESAVEELVVKLASSRRT